MYHFHLSVASFLHGDNLNKKCVSEKYSFVMALSLSIYHMRVITLTPETYSKSMEIYAFKVSSVQNVDT